MNPIELSLFSARINAICDEMGAVLRRTAFSPNIKDRLDFSCAIFDRQGQLCAQAAHIPVHLGSMAFAMESIISTVEWNEGDMLILNDPFKGGTHLPDITVIAPVFTNKQLCGFVTNRAHHADAGCDTPGSMPLSTNINEEGLIIPPTKIVRQGELIETTVLSLLEKSRDPTAERGDFIAQISANTSGLKRLRQLIEKLGVITWELALVALNNYAEKLSLSRLEQLPEGSFNFTDYMDDDGQGQYKIPITVNLTCSGHDKELVITVDFAGTADQVHGNINCPLSVTAAAVYYVFYCLMPKNTPACAGCFRPIRLIVPAKSLLNAAYPAAVVAGNVETSTRIVDVMLGALAQAIPDQIPAASHGSMNNIAMGAQNWAYYETLGGGMGANPRSQGLDAVQTHMTNTLNTPIEVLEMTYPLRISRYAIRQGSAGNGSNAGGEGLIRTYHFLEAATVSLLTERRLRSTWGLQGACSGLIGENRLNKKTLPAKVELDVKLGDEISISTPGGGGWGKISNEAV